MELVDYLEAVHVTRFFPGRAVVARPLYLPGIRASIGRTSGNPRSHPPAIPLLYRLLPGKAESTLWVVRRPGAGPISPNQLVAEVKGIYAGLVMVEAKCIEVDARQYQAALESDNDTPNLSDAQWYSSSHFSRHFFVLRVFLPSFVPPLRMYFSFVFSLVRSSFFFLPLPRGSWGTGD